MHLLQVSVFATSSSARSAGAGAGRVVQYETYMRTIVETISCTTLPMYDILLEGTAASLGPRIPGLLPYSTDRGNMVPVQFLSIVFEKAADLTSRDIL
jgi:hypothetical protein